MVATTPKKKAAPPKSPAKRAPKPVATITKSKSSAASPRPQRTSSRVKTEDASDAIVEAKSPRGKGRSAAGGGGSSAATSPRGTPRRGAADKANKQLKRIADDDIFGHDDEDDDAFDVEMEKEEDDDDDDDVMDEEFDEESPKKKRSRSKPATPRARKPKSEVTGADTVGTAGTVSRVQLAENLPAIRDVQGMFDDMVKKLPELQDLIKAIGRPLRVATMCSGTESPLLALDKIGNATAAKYGHKLGVDHVFSCEIEPFKQAYIERNFAPPILFRDIRELDEDQATTAYGALVDVPGNVDMLVAGTSCVDYSNLNNEKKGLDDKGESGQTFRGMMTWIEKNNPPIIILENVCNAPWREISDRFCELGYKSDFMRVDTKRYYIPHTRTRVYLVAVKTKQHDDYLDPKKKDKGKKDDAITQRWRNKVKSLERPASATLEAFLFDSDDPRVHKGRQMLAMPGEDSTRANTDWGRCESRHQRARLEEGLGARRPFTNWEGGCSMPDYAWNDWGKAQTDRVLDLMDIDYLRLACQNTDSMHKTLVWNLSQNVDRTTGSGAAGICPCLTPSMVPFVTNRGGPLVGIEALSLQGIPVDDLLLTRESEGQMSDLAGNAMTTTVVGACMLSALLLMKDELVAHTKKVEAGKKEEAKKRAAQEKASKSTMGKTAASLQVGGAAGAQAAAAKVTGADDLKDEELMLCGNLGKDPKKEYEALLKEANQAARLCVCEAQTGISDAIHTCLDCGHTACAICKGRPEHNFADDVITADQRILPGEFAFKLKKALPMRVKLDGLNVEETLKQAQAMAGEGATLMGLATMDDDCHAETWKQWSRAMKAVADAEFLFREVRRADVWTVRYVCPSDDEVTLELRVGSSMPQPEWRIIVNPLAEMDKPPHEIFAHPVARMRLAPGAKHLLDGSWQLLIPVRHEFDVCLEGKGEKRESWQETLGMVADKSKIVDEVAKKDRQDWTVQRWSEYQVSYAAKATKDILDIDITGTYRLYDKCGAAQASLHKRVGNNGPDGSKKGAKSNKSTDMYMFLDPVRNTRGSTDFFVFADNHRRLQYGEHRIHTARIDPAFRPSDNAETQTFKCYTDGRWMSPSKTVELKAAGTKSAARLAVPKDTSVLGSKSGGCGAAVAIMKASVPLPKVDAANWPEDEFVTLRNDRSHSTFNRLAWFTSRLELPEGVQKFVPLDGGKGNRCGSELHSASCPRCAPQPPSLQWTRKVGETKITAREDPLQAAAYEQALKRRPAPFVVQWRKQDAAGGAKSPSSSKGRGKSAAAASDDVTGDLVIAVNPATLVHRALANVTGGVARERSAAPLMKENAAPIVEWQVVRHEEKEAALKLKPFELKSNRHDDKAKMPAGWSKKYPLRPEQLRSLNWMLQQEKSNAPFVEEEVAESVHPALGLRMDGRARVERLVRGGIIADQVGYGKTAISIGVIMANQIQWPKAPTMIGSGKNAVEAPVKAIPTKATLVLAPSQLLRQWPREVEKFSEKGKLNVVVIRTVADITNLTVAEVQEADVVIAATSVLRSPLYFERLARLAGANSLPPCKSTGNGRHFASSYRDCLGKLEEQIETLTDATKGAAVAGKHVRKGASVAQEAVTVGPKRLKGAKLIEATVNAGGEGFKYVEQMKGEKAADLKTRDTVPRASPGDFRRRKPKANAPSPAPAAPLPSTGLKVKTGKEEKEKVPKSPPAKSPGANKKKVPPKSPKSPAGKRPGSSGMDSPPPASRMASPRGHLARASASKKIKYTDDASDIDDDSEFEISDVAEEEDDDFSDLSEDDEVADKKRKKAAAARKAKAKKRTKADSDDDESMEASDKDHWGFDTKEVQADWTETNSPPLEMFHWRRVVVDEFTYLKSSDRCVVLGLKSEARWCLSGTPPVGAFGDIKDTAALLGTNLGSDEQPRFTKSEITKAETFQFFKEKPTQHWHANRHSVAQRFLDRFVRQNIAEIDEIRSEEIPVDIQLRPAERAIYLELDHYLQSMDMKAKKKGKRGSEGDRDKRLAKVLAGSGSAEEALIKRCSKFQLDDESGTALRTCQDIVDVRTAEMEECKIDLRTSILDGRILLKEAEDLAAMKGMKLHEIEGHEDANNPFKKWEATIRAKGVGDPDATAKIQALLDDATLKKYPKHLYTKRRPPVGSVIKVNFGKEDAPPDWYKAKVMSFTGQHQQKGKVSWDKAPPGGSTLEVDFKKYSIANKLIQVVWSPEFGAEYAEEEPASARKGGKKGGKASSAKSTPANTPNATPQAGSAKKGQVAEAGSAAPKSAPATTTPGGGKKDKKCSVNDKMWELREHTHELRKLVKELMGRVRSLRFFQSVRDLQQMDPAAEVACLACHARDNAIAAAAAEAKGKGKGKRAASSMSSSDVPTHAKNVSGLLSTCGHVGCLKCLKSNADLQECGVIGCDCPARFTSVVPAASLGTERVKGSSGSGSGSRAKSTVKSPTKKGKAATTTTAEDGPTNEALALGEHGTKMAHLVQKIKDIPQDERILVFVQFPDLMKQVADVLDAAGIKALKLKGSVHQQTGALDEFQKETLGKNDARVLLLLSRDESASGANLTSANHAIFVHPLLTTTQYEYEASETQAIGRIRRYGQTKLVKVWRFIVRDSVDAEIIKQRGNGGADAVVAM